MMINKLMKDMQEAMRNKDKIRKDCLKMVLGRAKDIAKNNKEDIVTDSIVITAAKKEVKQLQQTLDSLRGHEDSDLYKETEMKKRMLEADYIPIQLTEDALKSEVERFVDENGLASKGKAAMKDIMSTFKDKAESKEVSKLAMDVLQKN